jgi:hypothetical protein
VLQNSEFDRECVNFRNGYRTLAEMVINFFICSLFNDGISNLDTAALNDWMMVDIVLGKRWKEAVMTSFKVLS